MSQPKRFLTLSACCRLSTAMMSVMPCRLSASTSFEPMNPAAPVTTLYISVFFDLFVVSGHGSPQLADHDAGGAVGDPHRRLEACPGSEHHSKGTDDSVTRAGDVEDFARRRLDVQLAAAAKQGHALLAAGHEQ